MKILIVVLLAAVLLALASAGLFMLRKDDAEGAETRDRRMARALAWRVGLSVTLFVLVLLGWGLGWLQPGGLPAGR